MKKLVYSLVCVSLSSSFALADHLTCKVSEQKNPKGEVTAQYELGAASEDQGAGVLTMGKTFQDTVGMEIIGEYKRQSNLDGSLSVQFTINGATKNATGQVVEISGTHLFYEGPVGRGLIQLDCDVKP